MKTTNEHGEIVKERKGLKRSNLPVKLPENQTWLKNSNFVTLMNADYSCLQLKILASIIEQLQGSIEDAIRGQKIEQMSLFQTDNRNVMINIPYQSLGIDPGQYAVARKVAKQMATIPVEFDAKDPVSGADSTCIKGLCTFYIPKGWARHFTVEMDKEVAKMFMRVEKGFTKFMKEIAFKSSSKYTFRIYWLISSWKDKGGFSIKIENFRKILSLENKYPHYYDLYKRVIRPVYEELFEKSDVWFEMREVYRLASDTEPYKLNFKIVKSCASPKEKEMYEVQKKYILEMCQRHLKFEPAQLNRLSKAITLDNVGRLRDKLVNVWNLLMEKGDTIAKPNNYCYVALMKEADLAGGEEQEELIPNL